MVLSNIMFWVNLSVIEFTDSEDSKMVSDNLSYLTIINVV